MNLTKEKVSKRIIAKSTLVIKFFESTGYCTRTVNVILTKLKDGQYEINTSDEDIIVLSEKQAALNLFNLIVAKKIQ